MKKTLVCFVLLFAAMASEAQTEKKPPPPPPPPPKAEIVKWNVPVIILDDFYKRNPSVEKITSTGHVITVRMKNGTIEKYDMKKKEEDKTFTEKYGVSPFPPPPPPPPKLLS